MVQNTESGNIHALTDIYLYSTTVAFNPGGKELLAIYTKHGNILDIT